MAPPVELDAATALTAPFTPLDAERVATIVREHFSLQPQTVDRLATERDDTFRVVAGGRVFVIKVAHPADDPAAIREQVAVLRGLESRDPELPMPRVIATARGEDAVAVTSQDGPRILRALSWLDGEPLGQRPRSAADLRVVGEAQARLAHAVAAVGATLPTRAAAPTPWNLLSVDVMEAHLPAIADPELRDRAAAVVARARRALLPRLLALPLVLAHNDAHGDNILVRPPTPDAPDAPLTLTGILDVGDLTRTPRIADLAVAVSYARGVAAAELAADPWAAATALAAGAADAWRDRGEPLTDDELALLPDLVLLRLAQRAALNSAVAAASADARRYAGRNLAQLATDLADLTAHPPPPTLGVSS